MNSYLMYQLLHITSKLPLEKLYLLSKIFQFLNRIIFKYRKKIITKNISSSFPQFQKKDTNKLVLNFYTFFFDNIVEIIKSISLKEKEIKDRVIVKNIKAIEIAIQNKKPIVLITSHYGNWEWLFLRVSLIRDINLYAVYKPLSSKLFNSILFKLRNKFGGQLIPLNKWKYFILENRKKPYSFMFLSDQVPSLNKYGRRIRFLNQSTLFYEGAEKTAKLLNANTFYLDLVKKQKGKYILEFQPMINKNLTKEYAKKLEEKINKKPENWLWSHNRWKR